MKSMEAHLIAGEKHLKASRPDLALPEYLEALQLAPSGAERMHVSNLVGRIRDLMGEPELAGAQFRQTLQEPQTGERAVRDQRGIALNNLGRLSLRREPAMALPLFEEAIAIYGELAADDAGYTPHLAHTHLARGEAFFLAKKFWEAKKDYKKALELHERHGAALHTDMHALAYYQLGAIYSEEYNAYDAQTNYRKALDLYSGALESDPKQYRPLLAATLNNLAVVQMQLEEYDKAHANYERTLGQYQLLSQEKPEIFEPYLAATHTNLGILLADHMGRHSEAILANEKAITLYEGLALRHPDRFTHYWATALHNGGIYTLETDHWQEAADALLRALSIRKELADGQKEAFGADYCATALNLLEFYQRRLEEDAAADCIGKGLQLLQDTGEFLGQLPPSPATENMKNDFDAFREFFHGVDAEHIRTLEVLGKLRRWDQETDSTLVLAEKTDYQARILRELRDFYEQYPDNPVLRKPLVLALNNRAWLHLCQGEAAPARALLEEGLGLGEQLPVLECNLGHCHLLEGKPEKARGQYRALLGRRNESGKDFREVIGEDLRKLESYGVLPFPAAEVFDSLGTGPAGSSQPS